MQKLVSAPRAALILSALILSATGRATPAPADELVAEADSAGARLRRVFGASPGELADPLRRPMPGFVTVSDSETVLHPLGLAPDHVRYRAGAGQLLHPYLFQIARGGALSLWHDHPGLPQTSTTALAGAEHGGLAGLVRSDHGGTRQASTTVRLRSDLATSTAGINQPFMNGAGSVRLELGGSTLAAFDSDARGFVVPDMTRADLLVETAAARATARVGGALYSENLSRAALEDSAVLDDLGVELTVDQERSFFEVEPRLGHTESLLGVWQQSARHALDVVQPDGLIAGSVRSRVTRTGLRAAARSGGSSSRWLAGLELIGRREQLRFDRDAVPQHRFPSPDSLRFTAEWTDAALHAGWSHDGEAWQAAAALRWEASEGYRGGHIGGAVELERAWSGHQVTFGAGVRHAFPGADALLGRSLPFDLSSAVDRRGERALSLSVRYRSRRADTTPLWGAVELAMTHAELERVYVPRDLETFAAVIGRGRGSELFVAYRWAPRRPAGLSAWTADGWFAWTEAEFEGGAYGTGTPTRASIRHRGGATVALQPLPRLRLYARARSQSGAPVTPVVGRIPLDSGAVTPVLGPPYSERLPHALRFDAGIESVLRLGRWDLRLSGELLNLANRTNPRGWRWNDDFTRRQADGMLPRILNVRVDAAWTRPPAVASP